VALIFGFVAITRVGRAIVIGVDVVVAYGTQVARIRNPVLIDIVEVVGLVAGVTRVGYPVLIAIQGVVALGADVFVVADTIAVVVGTPEIGVEIRVGIRLGHFRLGVFRRQVERDDIPAGVSRSGIGLFGLRVAPCATEANGNDNGGQPNYTMTSRRLGPT